VLERHVEEEPHGGIECRRIGPRHRHAGRLERLGVAGEGARRLAMHVARELVAQKDQGQRAVGRLPPGIEGPVDRPVEGGAEVEADLGIELCRAFPPDLARLAVARIVERQKPEIEDVADGRAIGH